MNANWRRRLSSNRDTCAAKMICCRGSLRFTSTATNSRLYAPPKATGDPLEWVGHLRVHQPSMEQANSENVVEGALCVFATKLAKEKLEQMKRDANRAVGMNPDNLYYDAQICLRGHVQSAVGTPFERGEHCKKCGAVC